MWCWRCTVSRPMSWLECNVWVIDYGSCRKCKVYIFINYILVNSWNIWSGICRTCRTACYAYVLALLASPLLVVEELLFSHPDNVPNKDDLNYIYNNNHTLSNTHDFILSIVILNCQESLLTKRAVLNTFVHEYNPDILGISETWLSPSITDPELLLSN